MRLQRIQELVYHRPWLITPSGHETIRGIIERKLGAEAIEKQSALDFSDFINARPEAFIRDGVGVVHIMGAIGVGFSKMEKTCGNTDVNDLMAEIRDLQKQGASRIMMIVDSPGGTVGGVAEVADEIAAQEVPIFSYIPAGGMNCSAAYWLTSGSDRIYASKTAEAGSIGVYLPWIDRSAMLERSGVKVDLIKNKEGDLKGAGFPGTPLTEAQRQDWQEGIQQIFEAFSAHIRKHRPGPIDADTLRGQSFWAADAYERKLIDGVATYESAFRALQKFKR